MSFIPILKSNVLRSHAIVTFLPSIIDFLRFKLLYQEGRCLPAQDEFSVFRPWPARILELFVTMGFINWFLRPSHNQPLAPEGFPQTVKMEVGACGYHVLHFTCPCVAGLCISETAKLDKTSLCICGHPLALHKAYNGKASVPCEFSLTRNPNSHFDRDLVLFSWF